MTESKPAPDWERIELDYRAGLLSLREIAKANPGASHVAIKKRADKAGWTRDLAAKIKAKADELVNRALVNKPVNETASVTEREVIEATALRIAQVRGEHRSDISRARTLGLTLMAELEAQSGDPELFGQLGDIMRKPDEHGADKMNDIYHRTISTPSRVDSVKKVAETLKIVIGMEREAYDLNIEKPPGDVPAGGVYYRINMPQREPQRD